MQEAFKEYLSTRRSVKAKALSEPGPNKEELEAILTIASRVPDHGKRVPFRFVVFDKAAQAKFGERLTDIYADREKDNPEVQLKHLEHERERVQRAPALIAVIFSHKMGKIPEWEQQLACGAACMNLLHAVYAHGYKGQWLTEWPSYDQKVAEYLGCKEEERIAGLVYIGSHDEPVEDRERPVLGDIVEWR